MIDRSAAAELQRRRPAVYTGAVVAEPASSQRIRPDELRRRLLATSDVLAAAAASAALLAAPGAGLTEAFWAFVLVPLWPLLAQLHGLYGRDQRALRHLTVDEIPAVLVWALTATGVVALILVSTPAGSLHVLAALQLWAVAVFAAVSLRALARLVWRRLAAPQRALIVGNGSLAGATRRKLELFPDIHIRIVGQFEKAEDLLARPEMVGTTDRLIVVASDAPAHGLEELLALARLYGVQLLAVLPPGSGFGTGARLHHVADLPVMVCDAAETTRAVSFLKRALDVVLASAALVVAMPLMLLIALAVRLERSGPVIFTQERIGLHAQRFRMFKFRTMTGEAGSPGEGDRPAAGPPLVKVRSDDPRITRVGRFLRRTSLDELPQLWNVLRGEMSLVGPRPELTELVARWPPEHRVRLSVKPGMTGPMQVYGRSDLTFDEWLAVEREYIEHRSIWRDLRILALTIPVAITGRGAF